VSLAERYRAAVSSLVTTVPVGKHKAETYFAQVTTPSRYSQLDFSTGAMPGTYQREP